MMLPQIFLGAFLHPFLSSTNLIPLQEIWNDLAGYLYVKQNHKSI